MVQHVLIHESVVNFLRCSIIHNLYLCRFIFFLGLGIQDA